MNIDVQIVTETFLRPSIPNSYVSINNFTVFRRDRQICYCRKTVCDKSHRGGGVLIYCRNSIHSEIYQISDNAESFWIKVIVNKEHPPIFINASYHPPSCSGVALLTYLTQSTNAIQEDHPNSTLFVAGDFNRLNLADLQNDCLLNQLHSPPTRENATLDLILTNNPNIVESVSCYEPSLTTDHKGVLLHPTKKLPAIRYKTYLRIYSFRNRMSLNAMLEHANFDDIYQTADINQAAEQLEVKIKTMVDLAFPLQSVTMSSKDPPWITPYIKFLLNKRKTADRLDQKWKVSAIENKIARMKTNRLTKMETKDWWRYIDDTTHRKTSNKKICWNQINPEILNQDLAKRSDFNERVNIHHELPTFNTNSFSPEISLHEVARVLSSSKATSPGPSGIPHFIFREYWDILSTPYHYVWNLSLTSGTFPTCYKTASVTAIPKVPGARHADDIRGVSVTPLSARLFEKVVHSKWILPKIVEIGDPYQFAYKPKMGTSDYLLTLYHYILYNLDHRPTEGVHVATIDFAKAFDRINQSIAVNKMKPIIANDNLCKWLWNFSINRKQYLYHDDQQYPIQNIDLGCAQGTVGGPNLFSMYTNDLQPSNKDAQFFKYSDDVTIAVKCLKISTESEKSAFNEEIDGVRKWATTNELTINDTKCKQIRFSLNKSHTCNCIKSEFKHCSTIDILGIIFQDNCKFSAHVKHLIFKLRAILYQLKDLKLNSLPMKEIDRVFQALIISKIRYGISIYGSDDHAMDKLNNFLNSCHRHHFTSLKFDAYNIRAEEDHRNLTNIIHNTKHPLHTFFKEKKQHTSSSTRHNLTILKPLTQTKAYFNSFCIRVLPL